MSFATVSVTTCSATGKVKSCTFHVIISAQLWRCHYCHVGYVLGERYKV